MRFIDEEDNKINQFYKTDANRHFGEDYIGLPLSHEVLFADDVVFQLEKNNTLVIGYLTADQDPMEFDFSEGESFQVFRTQEDRDNHFLVMQDEGKNPMLVNRYSHGADHYSILGTHTYPYHQFDVVPNGVYTPSEHDLEELKNGTINEQELNTRANATLDSYSDWANGNVYCVVVEKFAFNKGLDSWEPTGEPDSYGGYIGFKRAFESLKEEFMTFDPIPAPAPVVAQSKPQPSTGPSM